MFQQPVFIAADDSPQSMPSPGGSSTASSRDTSPCRELSPLVTSLKPPIIIKRGARGFGFTVNTIRVYYGDTNYYTMHHLVMVSLSPLPVPLYYADSGKWSCMEGVFIFAVSCSHTHQKRLH